MKLRHFLTFDTKSVSISIKPAIIGICVVCVIMLSTLLQSRILAHDIDRNKNNEINLIYTTTPPSAKDNSLLLYDGWKRYSSHYDGFSIMIPESWEAMNTAHNYAFFSEDIEYEGAKLVRGTSIYLSIYKNGSNISSQHWIQQNYRNMPDFAQKVSNSKGVDISSVIDEDGYPIFAIVSGKSRIYRFDCNNGFGVTQLCSSILMHILQSFEITGSIPFQETDMTSQGMFSERVLKMPFGRPQIGPPQKWKVVQGYNTDPTHHDYVKYALDLQIDSQDPNGDTAKAYALSPVSGEVAWVQDPYGCVSIKTDIAELGGADVVRTMVCHVVLLADISVGRVLRQGQPLGLIAPAWEKQNLGTSHAHIVLYKIAKGKPDVDPKTRQPLPFSGPGAFEGYDFPDNGTLGQWSGYSPIYSTNGDTPLAGCPSSASDSQEPDGDYDQPGNNQKFSDTVTLKGWARDDCGVDYVEFSGTWPGQDWTLVHREDVDCPWGQKCTYEHNWNIASLPDGWITLGFDIFDKFGKRSPSPRGTRQILKVGQCPGPSLVDLANGFRTTQKPLTFLWKAISCQFPGYYRFLVKTASSMSSGGQTVVDLVTNGAGSVQRVNEIADGVSLLATSDDLKAAAMEPGNIGQTISFGSRWENQPLYWSVTAEGAAGGSEWSSSREFQIINESPNIFFNSANGDTSSRITTTNRAWSFAGTAFDPENQLNRVEWRCDGDNCGNPVSSSGLNNWTYLRDNLDGRNEIYFVAYDNQGNRSNESRHLELNIDRSAPATTASLDGSDNPGNWPIWFTGPAQVRLQASDGATGRARVGVDRVLYRLDGGGWQTVGGEAANFTVSNDGSHTIDYYAVDRVGNQEAVRSASFRIDQTPPTAPGNASETHGVANDAWQKTLNAPTFTWASSTDPAPGSGLKGYQYYFGQDANGVNFPAPGDPRPWTPQSGGVHTGTYYLRARAGDVAGNWTPWATLFTFRYDGTPPENPGQAIHAAGVANDTWQKVTSAPAFTWPAAHDEGSGVKGYSLYWGDQETGTGAAFVTGSQVQSATPLCASDATCTGYLRLRSKDNVDLEAGEWTTAFVLRYDGTPPTVDFTINHGVTQTNQTLVALDLTADDRYNGVEGSGVKEMRLSEDGKTWRDWEVFTPEHTWLIRAISRQWWPVFVQVRDGVGLESSVVSHAIYLDVNPDQPRSASYRLFDHALSAGAGAHASTGYQGRSTVGQTLDAARAASLHYSITGGYQAGSRAIPLIEPGHDEFEFVNGIFASGAVAETLTSSAYQMLGTLGEPGLPNNQTTLASGSYRHQPGFLAAAPPGATPTPLPPPGPTPTPTPAPDCAFPSLSIDQDAAFTYSPQVTLSLCAPWAVEMMISNDSSFAGAAWEPFAASKPWTLTLEGQQVQPRFVYVQFKNEDGSISGAFFDDILYDPNPPAGTIGASDVGTGELVQAASAGEEAAVFQVPGRGLFLQEANGVRLAEPVALLSAQEDGSVDLYVSADDDNSGLAEIQISGDGSFGGAVWEPYYAQQSWTPSGGDGVKTVYARFRDSAGNISIPAVATFALDTLPPLGGIAIGQRVVGPDTVDTTVYLGAEDNFSGVSDLRLSDDATFANTGWMTYTTSVTWPISITTASEGTLYVQYRDFAGNASEVYSDTYLVDTIPPQLYVEVEPGETLDRTVRVYAYDELADLDQLRLSNDPLLFEGLATMPYTDTVPWQFDERQVVWVQVKDSVGNRTEPFPAYAALPEATPTATPTETPTDIPTPTDTPTPTPTDTPIHTPTPTPATQTVVLNLRVKAGVDDAEEKVSSGAVNLSDTDLEMINDVGGQGLQVVGLRFRNITIPKGATITKAYLEFTVDEPDSEATTLKIQGQAANTAAAFTTTALNVSSRTRTTAFVNWSNVPAWTTANQVKQSPELKTIVQEIVNRSGWASGNAMAFIITGSGQRTAVAYNMIASKAPLLHVEYIASGPTATPTATKAATATRTPTPGGPTATRTPTRVVTATRTLTPGGPTATRTPTRTPTRVVTATRTPTPGGPTATRTPTRTPTRAFTATRTPTPGGPTATRTPSRTPSRTPTRTRTPTRIAVGQSDDFVEAGSAFLPVYLPMVAGSSRVRASELPDAQQKSIYLPFINRP